jgi:hypothetical protein
MMRTPKLPPPPPPPPPPKPIPTATAPNVRQAAIEDARRNRGRSGRMSTLLAGSLGDGDYAAPMTERKTMLG